MDQQPNSDISRMFVGLVDASDASTYTLSISPIDRDSTSLSKIQGVAVSTCFANVFGFKDCDLIQPGSRVLCFLLQPNFCLVLNVIPNNDIAVLDYPARASLGAGDAIVDTANLQGYLTELNKSVLANNRRPTDVVDGEKVLQNDYGVALKLFSFMASLYGSPTAQIQCHLLDDLVRIISHNWEHNTAMGAFRVFHDGKSISAEFEATASPTEAAGVAEVNQDSTDSLFKATGTAQKDDSNDFYKINANERAQQIARFKVFLGKMGDFVNVFLARPSTDGVPRDLQGTVPKTFDTGLFQQRLAMDGGFYTRSVKEIFIEKTNWIRVPQRIRTPEDPSGDDGTAITFDTKTPYEFDTSFQFKDNPFLGYLQLRNYVAYVNEKLAYQNFKTQAKDFVVSDALTSETPLSAISNIDPQTPSTLQNFALRTSGIYLMENGGVTIKDAWGSGIIMEGGNVYIQPAKDLVLQPLRNMVGKVGKYISLAAQQDIDLSSTSGGIRFKADQALHAYSASSGIILQSEGTEASAGTPDPNTQAIEGIDGLVFKSKLGIFNFAQKTIASITPESFIVKAGQDVRIDAQGTAQVSATGEAILSGTQLASVVSDTNTLILSQGSAILAGAGSTVLGQKGQTLGVTFPPGGLAVDIQGVLDVNSLVTPIESSALKDTQLLALAAPFNTQAAIDAISFRFLSSQKYGLSEKTDPIPMTLSQQEDETSGLYGLTAWAEKVINNTLPYPGKENFDTFYASTQGAIPNLQPYSGKDFTGKPDASNAKWALSSTSLNNYKVQT
jgi:hypothetical protein